MATRSIAFDVLKGIAIIAVILYHFGLCPNGYLGVDIFLVIAGYFTSKSLWKEDSKSLWGGKYLFNRLLRLLPLLLFAEIFILGYGFLMMMPDDYENASQSVIASNFFANNILADITTKNYWDVVNEYKPLMHTWYLGILMQFYIIFVIIDLIINKIKEKNIRVYIVIWSFISCLSFLLYFMDFPASSKFYQIPFRLFEFGVGSLAFYFYIKKIPNRHSRAQEIITISAFIMILILLFVSSQFIDRQIRLLVTVAISFLLAFYLPQSQILEKGIWINRVLALIGMSSFSLFVWHQIVFALTRYSFTSDLYSPLTIVIVYGIIGSLTYLSYKYIEQMKFNYKRNIFIVVLFCVVNIGALVIFNRSGIFYDIPELEISTDDIRRGVWVEYCDRGYRYDREFSDSLKPKWMVVGNSFGRDFVNIILESNLKDKIDLSYASKAKDEEHIKRIHNADIVFISTLGLNKEFVEDIKLKLRAGTRLVIVGEKNFGINNGQVFRKRHQPNYYKETTLMEDGYFERNEENRQLYSNDFIDLISMAICSDRNVRVFSEDGRFISQDCRHLTRAGAQFYAEKIDWDNFYSTVQ